ncbi:MAG: hypothetical protein HY619_01235 [Thaumarchaeota archaeon]|nr:hypothetical protein [Nitrososphaerota archaeon]
MAQEPGTVKAVIVSSIVFAIAGTLLGGHWLQRCKSDWGSNPLEMQTSTHSFLTSIKE